jgi:hypothetical protein
MVKRYETDNATTFITEVYAIGCIIHTDILVTGILRLSEDMYKVFIDTEVDSDTYGSVGFRKLIEGVYKFYTDQ